MKTDHIAECKICKGYIDYNTNSYFQSDLTYQGECTNCNLKYRGDCKEVEDFIYMKGDYSLTGYKYKSFEGV